MAKTNGVKESDEEKPFVGFCRLSLVDQDGLGKQTKGTGIETALHMVKEDSGRLFVAELSKTDPIYFLRLGFDEAEFLTGGWHIGSQRKAGEHVNPNRMICNLQTVSGKKLNDMLDSDTCSNGVLKCSAVLPFIAKPYERPVDVFLHTYDYKLTTRIVKIEIRIPEDIYQEWDKYYKALKEFEKEDKADKDKDKDAEKKGDKKDEDSN
eukprot:GHVS01064467.1.p1 GENE.GHVS01064467.1~~GHVS01064467.1.p1  ORF type:complete len:208 (+),score=28.49 GHVS01064467.1:64-687(+)